MKISVIAAVAALCAFALVIPSMAYAATWGNYYLTSDEFGRCSDGRLTPATRVDECVRAVQSTLLRHTGQLAILDLLAQAFRDKNDFHSATLAYTKAIKFAASNEVSYYRYRRGQMYLEEHDPGMALADFDILLMANGEDGYGYLGLGKIAAAQGRYADAIVQYNKAAALRPNDSMILIARANAYAVSGDYQKAMADDNTVVGTFKGYGFAYNSRCWDRAIANRDLDAALADCNQALGELPDDPSILDSRGMVEFRQGRWQEAVADYNAALQHNPYFAPSLFMRGIAELRKGDTDTGRSDIAKAEVLVPGTTKDFAQYGISP